MINPHPNLFLFQSISPGLVHTETTRNMKQLDLFKTEKLILDPEDIVDGVMYALSTPPHVQVKKILI